MGKVIYSVKDIKDEAFYITGNADELSEKIGYNSSYIKEMCRKNLLINDRYEVSKIGFETVRHGLVKKYIRTDNDFNSNTKNKETTLQYLINHLNEFGNTVLKAKPQKYISDLKKCGINVTYEKYRIPKVGCYYIITKVKE